MADICEVDTHISKRYDVKKRLGKGVSIIDLDMFFRDSVISFVLGYCPSTPKSHQIKIFTRNKIGNG